MVVVVGDGGGSGKRWGPLLRQSKRWIATTEIHNVDSPGSINETETEESLITK